MWKLARKAVADTSAFPRSAAAPWWEQSFLFPIKRASACPLRGNRDKSHSTLSSPAGRGQGSARGCWASPGLAGQLVGLSPLPGEKGCRTGEKDLQETPWNSQAEEKSSRRLRFHIINS